MKKTKDDSIRSIDCGSDLDLSKIDELIIAHPEMAVLKFLGEINVEIDADMATEDGTFSAHNQSGNMQNYGNSKEPIVKSLKIFWKPDEKDLSHAEDCEIDAKTLELFKKKILSDPRASYDLSQYVTADEITKIEQKLIEDYDQD